MLLAKRQAAQNEIKAMADKDLIEESSSTWSSPVLILPKRDGSIRFCIDYCKLNKVTSPDSQPLLRFDESLDALRGSKLFSTLDLQSAFHQLEMAKSSRPSSAFCIPGSGLCQFKVTPIGAINSPAVFERLMEKNFSGFTYNTLLIHLDNIIVYSKIFYVHLTNLEEALKRLSDANLKLNPQKCTFFQKKVSFWAIWFQNQVLAWIPRKSSVQNWPVPETVTEARSFVGLCSYKNLSRDLAQYANRYMR